jgi:hypothetical protein
VDAGGAGQLIRSQRALTRERAVEPEPVADVDAVDVQHRSDCFEQALAERVAPARLVLAEGRERGHRASWESGRPGTLPEQRREQQEGDHDRVGHDVRRDSLLVHVAGTT